MKGGDVNSEDEIGQTALGLAVFHGHFEIVKTLIEAGANVFREELLGDEAQGGNTDIIRLSLDMGADPEQDGFMGYTPLLNAALGGHIGAVRLFLELGSEINAKTL